MNRYYCDEINTAEVISLPDDQAHHALHVMRLRHGEIIEIFDGRGHFAQARAVIQKKHLHFQITGEVNTSAPLLFELHIASAIPKADRSEQLVESASQLGVHTLRWLDCQRSVVKFDDRGRKMEKWRRVAIESAKQCGRNWLLNIDSPIPVSELIIRCTTPIIFADPRSLTHLMAWTQQKTPPRAATMLIGPEGGFSPEEIKTLQASGALAVSLGANILRIETAVAAAAAIMSSWSMPPLS